MHRIVSLCFFFALAVTACQISPREQAAGGNDTTASEAGTMQQGNAAETEGQPDGGVDRNSVLAEESSSRQFDGKGDNEQFRVALFGDDVLSGTVAFTIINGDGELIYSDEFPATMLAATYDESINTPEKQEALIRKRIEEFFLEERFKQPAIEGNQPPFDSFFVEKATYDDLRETKAPGFLYLTGKENTKHIAWSPLDGKVVMYFNCC